MTQKVLLEEYKRTHRLSQNLHNEAVKHFAANGATHGSRILEPFRPYITHAKGSRKWDIDGNEYVDFVMGHGALILGHSHPVIVRAIQSQVEKGLHYGENHELEIEWAKLIKRAMPSVDRVEFCASGMEVNLMAARLARTFTGRSKILRFEENFHGWAAEVAPPNSAGVHAPDVSIIPMNDVNIVEKALATNEYAAVFTEGGGAIMDGQVPWDTDFIRTLPSLTKKYGTVWVMDEVVTGFRDAPGGWQSLVGVTPDLTTLGKCVGGGLPVGAVVGRGDIMEAFNPRNPTERRIRHSGTWNSNPLLCAAGIAACQLYQGGKPQETARKIADYFRQEGNRLLKAINFSGRLYGRTIVHFYIGPVEYEPVDDALPPTKDFQKLVNPANASFTSRLTLHLLQRGVANFSQGFFVLSAAHSKKDIDQTVDALEESIEALVAEGL